jgi:hypothetical protein
MRRETVRTAETTQHADGTTNTTVRKTTRMVKTARVTYKQHCPAYNAAQQAEKATFPTLLRDLCAGTADPPQAMGYPTPPLRWGRHGVKRLPVVQSRPYRPTASRALRYSALSIQCGSALTCSHVANCGVSAS